MRHGKKFNHLGRTASHRKAMLANMASSLIVNKRINTTLAKAKALKKYVEPLITKAKDDSTHSRRTVFSYLQDKESVKTLFSEVVDKVGNRPGGYTRIIKTGFRLGDNAEMCMMELVDFNELLLTKVEEETTTKTRRSRRGKKKASDETTTEAKAAVEAKEETPKAEEAADESKDESGEDTKENKSE
ncbi:MAG: 50S ribosomal protein L17 [Cyclobacteriaceae bacterium]